MATTVASLHVYRDIYRNPVDERDDMPRKNFSKKLKHLSESRSFPTPPAQLELNDSGLETLGLLGSVISGPSFRSSRCGIVAHSEL
mmetsp:Transcript_56301/g.89405  ORF Transcript_56301/g.89405 Transcript_56301/m.89405 type:complete len:86 (+) Transcript_56301:82-339(+)